MLRVSTKIFTVVVDFSTSENLQICVVSVIDDFLSEENQLAIIKFVVRDPHPLSMLIFSSQHFSAGMCGACSIHAPFACLLNKLEIGST